MFGITILKFGFLFGEDIHDKKIQSHIRRLGYTYRVIELDELSMCLTDDFEPNRLDICISSGKIIYFS